MAKDKTWIGKLASLFVLVVALLSLASPAFARYLVPLLALVGFVSLVSMIGLEKKRDMVKYALYGISIVVYLAFVVW